MSKNQVQFQSGYSLLALFNDYGLKINAGSLFLTGNGQKVLYVRIVVPAVIAH